MNKQIAIIGATESMGREVLNSLAQIDYPVSNIIALAPSKMIGREVSYGLDDVLKIKAVEEFDFSNIDIAISTLSESLAKDHILRASKQNTIVIDTSSAFRGDEAVPLIIPEINDDDIINYKNKNIISCPNSITTELLMAINPIKENYGIKRIISSTYQSVSKFGQAAMDELFTQTRGIYVNESPLENKKVFAKQIAFNVLPKSDEISIDGFTEEEQNIADEVQKILGTNIKAHINSAIVPAFIGEGQYINIETDKPVDIKELSKILSDTDGLVVFDKTSDGGYVTQTEVSNEDDIFISRIKKDTSVEKGVSLWVVADNLRKGSSLNAVQIAEILIEKYL